MASQNLKKLIVRNAEKNFLLSLLSHGYLIVKKITGVIELTTRKRKTSIFVISALFTYTGKTNENIGKT